MSTTATGQSIELENVQPTHNNQLSPTHQPHNHSVSRDPVDRSPNYTPPLKPVDYPTDNPSKLTTYPNTQSAIQHTNQPYTKPANQSKFLWLYYVWVNPWIRWLSIIAILYIYALSSGVLTYRHNVFESQMQYLLNIKWKEAYGGDDTMLPPSSRPDREAGQSYDIVYDGQVYTVNGYMPFVLKDLWFEFIPALQGTTRQHWKGFADATPIIFNVVMLLMLFIRRDVVRLAEYISIQSIMFAVNALVHVSTTFPDANGQQDSCKDFDKQQYGMWMFRMISTVYCGDMLWSGHTANTLVPIIMIRRLMWDYLGWNITWDEVDDASHEQRNQFLSKHSQIFSGWHNSHERNQLFMQWMESNRIAHKSGQPVQNNQLALTSSTGTLDNYTPAYPEARSTAIAQKGVNDPEIVADELALQQHENHDIHLNIAAATAIGPNQQPNNSSDKFFKIYKSPYRSAPFVQKHRKAFFIATSIVRFCLIVWFAFLCISIILIRYHYSVDVIIACFVSLLVCTNTHLLQWWVRMIYRPNFSNYLTSRAWWRPVYLHWPLNEEQINFEERVRRVGIGGCL